MADLTPEQRAEARAYRRMTLWLASGAAALLLAGGYAAGRWNRTEAPVLRNDYQPATPPVTVYCGEHP